MSTQNVDDPVVTEATKSTYLSFVRRLYARDPGYCATSEFSLVSALDRSTAFFRSCFLRPLVVERGGEVQAACILVHDRALPAVQVAFFEALPDVQPAVDVLLAAAKDEAERRGLDRVVVGLNGHLSIGVGILTDGFGRATFASSWNKPYYAAYFSGHERHDLTTYGGSVDDAIRLVRSVARSVPTDDVTVRTADPRRWDDELEVFRRLCDATLGTTADYAPTLPGHFADLMRDLLPFLRPENLLFAVADGREVGFVFWHPDFNEVLPTGRALSIPTIAWRLLTRRRRIRTVVGNAIGKLPDAPKGTTAALMARLADELDGRYDTYETCFVWDGNGRSREMLGRYLGGLPARSFAVWELR